MNFTHATRSGLRDKVGYDALLTLIDYVLACDQVQREEFLLKLLCRFVEVRESSNIALTKLNRVSVAQYERLLAGLLKVPSGGRIPVMIVVSVLHALKVHFLLD